MDNSNENDNSLFHDICKSLDNIIKRNDNKNSYNNYNNTLSAPKFFLPQSDQNIAKSFINYSPYYFVEENKLINNRLNSQKLFYDDSFEREFSFQLSLNEKFKKQKFKNYQIEIPFNISFKDSNYTPNENYYYTIQNKNNKKSFLNMKDIEKMKKNEIKLDFGLDPCDIYYELCKSIGTEKEIKRSDLANTMSQYYKFVKKQPPMMDSMKNLFYKNISNKKNNIFFNNDKKINNIDDNINKDSIEIMEEKKEIKKNEKENKKLKIKEFIVKYNDGELNKDKKIQLLKKKKSNLKINNF